jgi:hypothetical protein
MKELWEVIKTVLYLAASALRADLRKLWRR